MDRRQLFLTVGAVAASAAGAYWLGKRTKFSGCTYVQMGTSVTEGLRPSTSITPSIVGDRLGMPGINAGLPGACTGHHKYPEIDHRSLFSLADAIVSGNWTAQNAEEDIPSKANLARLKTADFSRPTYLGLEYGTNDFNYSRPIGSSNDTTRETFKGALNHSITELMTAFPRLRLFLITPAWRLNFEDLDSDTHPNEIGLFLREYVNAMMEIATLHHIPWLDMWRSLGGGRTQLQDVHV
jgi:hypothetical protein